MTQDASDGSSRPRAVLIAGPTAGGKSALAAEVASRTGGVIVNADASQVYRGVRILTARPSREDEAALPHRLYGFVPPTERFSVKAWLDAARAEISSIEHAGQMPVIIGGTGLYFRALLNGLADVPEIPPPVREAAAKLFDTLGPEGFHARLTAVDPASAERLHRADRTRRVRAYEVAVGTGRTLADWIACGQAPILTETETLRLVVAPEREALVAAIDRRFETMIAAGAVEEVRALLSLGIDPSFPIMKALGVLELAAFLAGEATLEVAKGRAQARTKRYAKRQMTWARGQMASWEWLVPQYSVGWGPIASRIFQFPLDSP